MRHRTTALALLVAAAAAVSLGASQPAPSPPAPAPASVPAPVNASIDKVAFLQGDWSGHMGQDHAQEIWSAPHGDNIIGCFRWVKADGKLSMAELLTITQENGTLVLRMRHHNGKLEGWKSEVETNTAMTLVLSEIEGSRAVFANAGQGGDVAQVSYTVTNGDTLVVSVRFVKPERRPLEFALTRA